MTPPRTRNAWLVAGALYVVWVLATWFLEGRPGTLLQPEAAALRMIYAGVANLGIGIVGAIAVVVMLVRRGSASSGLSGFNGWRRTLIWGPPAAGLGILAYLLQEPPTLNGTVLLNAYAQVLVVSTAEVLVCWGVIAGTILTAGRDGWRARLLAAAVASALFGLYHFAHSSPFNTWMMVALLTGVGLVTSLVFLLTRDLIATLLFHNGLAVLGVVRALEQQDALAGFTTPQLALLLTGAGAVALALIGKHLVERAGAAGPSGPAPDAYSPSRRT